MKKALLAIAALLSGVTVLAQYRDVASSYQELYDSETVSLLKRHVGYIAGAEMEGRLAGSEGERMTAEYIASCFEEYGVDVISPRGGETFGIVRENGDTVSSRNVIGYIQGWDSTVNDRYIVIGARMDNLGSDTYTVDGEPVSRIYYGANGNASGLAMLLELSRKISTNRILFRRSVLFVAFGASEYTLAGSWYFLNRSFADVDRIDAMVNLDMVGGSGSGFYAYTSSNTDLNSAVSALRGELLPILPVLTTEEPYTGDHRAFYDREIPSVLFTTGRYPEHDTGRDSYEIIDFDKMERELETVYCFSEKLSSGEAPRFRESASAPKRSDVVAYSDTDVKPAFFGSRNPSTFLTKWVYQYVKYPSYALENGIQGRVTVDFVIDEKGNVTDVTVGRSVHESLDAEAVRVVSASPRWTPGRRNGKKVKVAMSVPVEFRLQKRSDGSFGVNGIIVKQ